jgi:hypothetical protein
MAGTYLIQVSDQTGVPAAVSYGCKKYRVSKDTRVDKLVDTVVKDHGLPDDSDYMKDKMMCVKVGIGDAQDETFLLWEGETTKGMSLKEFAFSERESIPNRVAIMNSAWQREVADDDIREIHEVKEEDHETEWGLRNMTRQEWVFAKGQQMSHDVAQVADKYEDVLNDLRNARKDVMMKEEGLFEIGKEFATRYLDTKMWCLSEGVGNGMLSDWKTNRLEGVLANKV